MGLGTPRCGAAVRSVCWIKYVAAKPPIRRSSTRQSAAHCTQPPVSTPVCVPACRRGVDRIETGFLRMDLPWLHLGFCEPAAHALSNQQADGSLVCAETRGTGA
eukprot:365661-Chlamydomonas_euryale.AAC.35